MHYDTNLKARKNMYIHMKGVGCKKEMTKMLRKRQCWCRKFVKKLATDTSENCNSIMGPN